MNIASKVFLVFLIALIMGHNIYKTKKIESYLTHNHGYDASKELGFYKAFEGKE